MDIIHLKWKIIVKKTIYALRTYMMRHFRDRSNREDIFHDGIIP